PPTGFALPFPANQAASVPELPSTSCSTWTQIGQNSPYILTCTLIITEYLNKYIRLQINWVFATGSNESLICDILQLNVLHTDTILETSQYISIKENTHKLAENCSNSFQQPCETVILRLSNSTPSVMLTLGYLAISIASSISLCGLDHSPRPETSTFSKSILCPFPVNFFAIAESFSNTQCSFTFLGGLFIFLLYSPILL
ncbi:hypothetical protein CSKR_109894, partial [Clonorchis sinensis]